MKNDVVNDNNLKVVMSDDDINILIEIKDVHIDNDKIRQALLCCLKDRATELKGDMMFIKKASNVREDTGSNTQSLSIILRTISITSIKLLKLKKRMMTEFLSIRNNL